ncbi:hypothetical protein [Brassicibacter mesophilus]|uniref:hypothetical protein n=1 Tax=Brassicibacter mesophilus TaxID=745119 RepID=UPI003D203C3A
MDFCSVEGRKVAYSNYNHSYDYRLNNIPEKLTAPNKEYDDNFTYASKNPKSYEIEYVFLENVVGSKHGRYEGRTWFEMFIYLKKTRNIINLLMKPDYYNKLESEEIQPEHLSFIKIDDDYYVNGGNHRVTIAKLKGIKSILAPVLKLETSEFHKSFFKKISNLRFDVSLEGDSHSYYNTLTGLHNKHKWEVFKIKFNISSIYLYNEDMIIEFYNTFINLNVSDKAVKMNEFRKHLLKFESWFIKSKADQYEAWYEKYMTNGVKNFFLENYLALSEHKKYLNLYKVS